MVVLKRELCLNQVGINYIDREFSVFKNVIKLEKGNNIHEFAASRPLLLEKLIEQIYLNTPKEVCN